MLYEIKINQVNKDGRNYNDTYMATEVEMATKNGLDAIKFLQEGKKRYTWAELPNEYQMKKYIDKFEITVAEATTGKNICKLAK